MTRGIGLVGMLVALALLGVVWGFGARSNGPTAPTAERAETRAASAASGLNFTQAAMQLETYHAENGTYVGATLPAAFGVLLARADAASYCLQSGPGAPAQHVVGPGGTPAAGSC